MKTLIVMLDGTWQSADSKRPSNIFKLSRMIKHNEEQEIYYDSGVGTQGWKISGGAFGIGIDKHIKNAYKFIFERYEDNDRIIILGYSRGAYSARALAGWLGATGLVRNERDIKRAYKYYRTEPHKRASKRLDVPRFPVKIDFLGVFDTVGSLGWPRTNWPLSKIIRKFTTRDFHDTKLGHIVEWGYHAVAINENRKAFTPTLWGKTNFQNQKVEEIWYKGRHSDIGGGSPHSYLSNICLLEVKSRLSSLGIEFATHNMLLTDINAPISKQKKFWWVIGTTPRVIPSGSQIYSLLLNN